MSDKIIITLKFLIITTLVGGILFFSKTYFYKENKLTPEAINILGEQKIERLLQISTEEETPKPSSVRVPILVYHSVRHHIRNESTIQDEFDVTPEELDQQIQYLKDQNYKIISFEDLANYFNDESDTINLPEKSAIITFDDGWENQYLYAMPVLKKQNVTATFFVYTNVLGKNHFMTWEQVKDLDKLGMTIGSHTKSHPLLFKVTDENELRQEIVDSKKILEKELNKEIYVFADPYGYSNDLIVKWIKKAGYKIARTTYKGIYHTKEDIFSLKAIDATDSLDHLIKAISI